MLKPHYVTIDGSTFSVYDIDLTKYTKYMSLDGYNIRQFRIRHWPADGNFELSSKNDQAGVRDREAGRQCSQAGPPGHRAHARK